MKKEQQAIDNMCKGDITAIKEYITSDIPNLVMNSIIFGVKIGLKDEDYVRKLEMNCSSKTVLMGVCLGNVAQAALCILTDKPYLGNNSTIKSLIKSNFEF